MCNTSNNNKAEKEIEFQALLRNIGTHIMHDLCECD